MRTHRADNLYYISYDLLRTRGQACVSGATEAMRRAGSEYANINISLATAMRVSRHELNWLAAALVRRRKLAHGDRNRFDDLVYTDAASNLQVATAFMNLIEGIAIREGKLLTTPCPTCGR